MMHPHSSHHTNNGNHPNHHHLHHNHLPFHRNNKHHHCQEDLFQSYTIFSSCDEDESSTIVDGVKPLPSLTMSHRLMITQDLKMSDIRSQLISHKLLLTNLIKVNESEVRNLVKSTKQRIKQDDLLDEPGQTYLDKILETSRNSRISSKFPQNVLSIRKGICCFEDDLCKCDKPSLPFSRHCQRHILYNVDQLLFVRCTAKNSESIQCSNPSLDVLRDEPLCNHHFHLKSLTNTTKQGEDESLKANNLMNVGPGNGGKGKLQVGPGRPAKRTKKRRKLTGGGKGIPGSVDNVDNSSLFSQDSADSHLINSNNCDTSHLHLSSIKTEPNNEPSLAVQPNQSQSSIISTIPQTMSLQVHQQHHLHQQIQPQQPQTQSLHHHQPQQQLQHHLNNPVVSPHLSNDRTTHDSLSNIPNAALMLRGDEASLAQTLTSSVPVVLPDITRNGIISGHLDGCVTSLAPSDEALVASLVADLPSLCTENGPEPEPPGFVDADLTDVLNKIPDDAFNDLFVDNLKNGDIPSKEESEALEQALAAVSKNVQYLSVAAAVVGSGSRSAVNNLPREGVTPTTVINGDSNYYSHPTQHHNHQHHHHHHQHQHQHHHQHHHHHHGTVNGEIPQLSHHHTSSVTTLTTPSSQLTHQQSSQTVQPTPTQSAPLGPSSVPNSSIVPPSQSLISSSPSHHDLAGRSIPHATSLNLNENDILGLANNILTSLTTEQQQQLNGLIDGALASGSLTSPTIKSALASFSNLPQESESCEAHL